MMLRCTGFGKTWLMSKLTARLDLNGDLRYKHILYVYPSAVIRDTAEERIIQDHINVNMEDSIDRIEFVSYTWLSVNYNDNNKLKRKCKGKDLIIFDECHSMGAEQAKIACAKIMNVYASDAHFIGATATVERMDNFDVVQQFFNNITTFSYTLHDAINDGIIQKPYYCYCTHSGIGWEGNIKVIEEDLKENALSVDKDFLKNNKNSLKILKSRAIEIANIFNMPTIIKETVSKLNYDKGYMKFLCFFSNINQMSEKAEHVVSWFQEAFPDKKINLLVINSSTKEYHDNVHKLNKLYKENNKIDLVCSIDMLTQGYHVEDITGVIMYRATKSSNIFIQQLGRALSTGNTKPCIVFDVVNNIHRKSILVVKKKKKVSGTGTGSKKDFNVTAEKLGEDGIVRGENRIAPVDKSKLTAKALKELEKLENLNESEMFWKDSDANSLNNLDVIATGNMATYRELIAKVVAEPITRRCMSVVELHLKRWCMSNNIEYPINMKDLDKVMDNGEDAFRNYMRNIVKANNFDYPILDAKALLEMDKELNLQILCDIKSVSLEGVLNLLGLKQ